MKHVEIFCKIKSADIFLDGIGAYKIINKKGTIFTDFNLNPIADLKINFPIFSNSNYLNATLLNNNDIITIDGKGSEYRSGYIIRINHEIRFDLGASNYGVILNKEEICFKMEGGWFRNETLKWEYDFEDNIVGYAIFFAIYYNSINRFE